MLEMVAAKSDPDVAAHFDGVLLAEEHALGQLTRVRLQSAIESISEIKQVAELLEREPAIARSLAVRHRYMEPLHVAPAELLRRDRESTQQPLVEYALMASAAGIAAGMRNTG